MPTNDELIRQMYANSLASTNAQLETDYKAALENLDQQKVANQEAAEKAVTATKTEADRAAVAKAEYAAASGLSSGARAQARIARDNQLANDLTAIRTAQIDADAEIERKRGLLAQDYAAAISKAQADNDLKLAEALYEEAKKAEDSLRADQRAAADLLAKAGDFTRYGQLYGLSEDEIAALRAAFLGSGEEYDTHGYTEDEIKAMQGAAGLPVTGRWDAATENAYEKGWRPESKPQDPMYRNYFNQFQSADNTKAINMNSVFDLGYGRITGDELSRLLQDGLVEAYEDGGEIYFRNVEQKPATSLPGQTQSGAPSFVAGHGNVGEYVYNGQKLSVNDSSGKPTSLQKAQDGTLWFWDSGSNQYVEYVPTKQQITIDQNSIDALGYGVLPEERLWALIESGDVRAYLDGFVMRFQKTRPTMAKRNDRYPTM